jgi:hypothetical protein
VLISKIVPQPEHFALWPPSYVVHKGSHAFMPAYVDRQRRIIFGGMPWRRASSSARAPTSNSRKIAMICAAEKRLLRIGGSGSGVTLRA